MKDHDLECAAKALLRLSCRGFADVAFFEEASLPIVFDDRPGAATFRAAPPALCVSRRLCVPELALALARMALRARRVSEGAFPDPQRQTRDAYVSDCMQFELDADWHEMMVARELLHRTQGAVRASLLRTAAARRYYRLASSAGRSGVPSDAELRQDRAAGPDALRQTEARWRKGRAAHLFQTLYPQLRDRWERAQGRALRRPRSPVVLLEQRPPPLPRPSARLKVQPRRSGTASLRRVRLHTREQLSAAEDVTATQPAG